MRNMLARVVNARLFEQQQRFLGSYRILFFLLNRFKVPRSYYQWRQPFPATTTGKIRREELKRELLAAIRLPSNL